MAIRKHNNKKFFYVLLPLVAFFAVLFSTLTTYAISSPGSSDKGDGTYYNPVIWADTPDMDIIRVGDTYWMSSTTMHMNPGVPIMKSKDMVNWETVSYCYNVLEDIDAMKLQTGGSMYSNGTWASTLRYKDGIFYLIVPSNTTRKTYIFQTEDPENIPWRRYEINRQFHDCGLLMDDDGRNWLVYGSGQLRIIELNEDVTGLKPGAQERIILQNIHAPNPDDGYLPPSGSGLSEGAHIRKIDGMYYIFCITSEDRGWMRQQVCHRAASLEGPWEAKVVARESISGSGVGQGDIIDDGEGNWYGLIFRDSGAVGRIPWLMPVTWVDGWPMHGEGGLHAPIMREGAIPIQIDSERKSVMYPDEFYNNAAKPLYYESSIGEQTDIPEMYAYNGSNLNLAWQWNHNQDNTLWSLTERPGWLRLRTGYIAENILRAPNTLTQRTFGPQSAAITAIDVSGMKDGDEAGLSLFTAKYGSIGVKMEGNRKFIVTKLANSWSDGHTTDAGMESDRVQLTGDTVYLKAEAAFSTLTNNRDKGDFYYSLDGTAWTKLGGTLNMSYSTSNHFMGYRFALYNFSRTETGGYVDFDYFRLDDTLTGAYEPVILGASMTNKIVIPGSAGTNADVPVQLDPLPNGSYTELAASFEIPAEFEVTGLAFSADVTGNATWKVKGNQLELEVTGSEVGFAPAARSRFAVITLKLRQKMEAGTARSIIPDYVIVKGGNVVYNPEDVKTEITFIADKTNLDKQIKEAKSKNASAYTSASWTALQTALSAAEAVNGNASATQEQVDAAAAALTEAISALIKKPDANIDIPDPTRNEPEVPKKNSIHTQGRLVYQIVTSKKTGGTVKVTGMGNKKYTNITIPGTVKLGGYTFKVTEIKKNAFRNSKNLKKVTLKNNITKIGARAFSNCPKLKSVTIGKKLKTIGKEAFSKDKLLKSIKIHSSKVRTVGKNAFRGIAKKARIKVPKNKVKNYNKIFRKDGRPESVKIGKK